jgi:hypothetical protein
MGLGMTTTTHRMKTMMVMMRTGSENEGLARAEHDADGEVTDEPPADEGRTKS